MPLLLDNPGSIATEMDAATTLQPTTSHPQAECECAALFLEIEASEDVIWRATVDVIETPVAV